MAAETDSRRTRVARKVYRYNDAEDVKVGLSLDVVVAVEAAVEAPVPVADIEMVVDIVKG